MREKSYFFDKSSIISKKSILLDEIESNKNIERI